MLLTLPTAAAALLLPLSNGGMGSPALLEEPHGGFGGLHPKLTQLRDAPDAGGQQGLLQGPQLQLRIGVSPAVAAHGAVMVGAEVGREGQHTWDRAHSTPLNKSAYALCGKANPSRRDTELAPFSENF